MDGSERGGDQKGLDRGGIRKAASQGSSCRLARGYQARADECLRLASDTADRLIRGELLKLAQLYTRLAHTLRSPEREKTSLARH